MRLPKRKLWRAFPELDPYTDSECRAYVREAKARWLVQGCFGIGSVVMLGLIATLVSLSIWSAWVGSLQLTRSSPNRLLWSSLLIDLVWVVVLPSVPSVCFLIARDVWLRFAVRARLSTAKCGQCGYSLLGLTPIAHPETGQDVVQCPECGMAIPLEDAGLTHEDLMPRSHPPTTRPPTP